MLLLGTFCQWGFLRANEDEWQLPAFANPQPRFMGPEHDTSGL